MNRIPRKFNSIVAEAIRETNACKPGDRFIITRNDNGCLIGTNIRTEKEYQIFPAHLRDITAFRFITIFL